MRIYDISLTITPELPIYPGDPAIVLERIAKMEDGDSCNITHLSMSAHVGTHVDAPFHFLGGNTSTVERLPLNLLIGRAYVLNLPDDLVQITAADLQQAEIPPRTRRLLLKTRNSKLWSRKEKRFQTDFVALNSDAAQYLVNRGIKLVGIDYLSVAPFRQGEATHKILLQAGVVVLEGLHLSEVSQGRYSLYCLPLKLAGSDGAPARAILIGV
jgi:arylformamidase